jgi:hypothetical protein
MLHGKIHRTAFATARGEVVLDRYALCSRYQANRAVGIFNIASFRASAGLNETVFSVETSARSFRNESHWCAILRRDVDDTRAIGAMSKEQLRDVCSRFPSSFLAIATPGADNQNRRRLTRG